MSGVTSATDGGYTYYQKNIDDLEDELKSDAKRKQERQEKEIQDVEDGYKAEALRREEELQRTARNIEENSNRSIASEREMHRAELNDLKARTYDKFGRYSGLDSDALKSQLDHSHAAWEQEHARHVQDLDDTEARYESRIDEMNQQHADDLEKTVREARDSASESYNGAFEREKSAYEDARTDNQKKYEELNRQKMQDMEFQRRQYEKALGESKRDFQHQVSKLQDVDQDALAKQSRYYEKKNENDIKALEARNSEDTQVLRDHVDDLIHAESNYMHDRADGRADAIRELEGENNQQKRLIEEGYQQQIANLNEKAKVAEKYMAHNQNRVLQDKDAYFAGVIRAKDIDAHLAQNETQKRFDIAKTQLEKRNQRDRELAAQALQNQADGLNEDRAQALESQAKAYQETHSRQAQADGDKIRALEKQLQERQNTSDISVISPAVQERIENSVIARNEKTMQADHERAQRSIDSVQENYSDRLEQQVNDARTRATIQEQQNTFERHHDQQAFLDHVQDTDFVANAKIRDQEIDHAREREQLQRNFALNMERQRRQYEEILANAKDDAAIKTQMMRQESEFQAKSQQRAFSNRQNEIAREYDKKLADQKMEYELKLQDLKAQTERELRETEKKARTETAELQQSFDQRVAQLEYQHKERERYLAQNYEDQIERTRRSNELSYQQKKG